MDELDQMVHVLDEAERALNRARHEVVREHDLIRYWGDSETGQCKQAYVKKIVSDTATNVREMLGGMLVDLS